MLRMNLSPLRAHKYKYNFVDTSDPFCTVCESPEDTEHYLLYCRSYTLSRATMMRNISNIINFDISTMPKRRVVSTLLYGMEDLHSDTNLLILNEVVKFIALSKRLDAT